MTQWRFILFDVLDSTSSYCSRQLELGEKPGFAVLALKQTNGRGTKGRAWESSSGNLAFSFTVPEYPTVSLESLLRVVPYLTALAVRNALLRTAEKFVSAKEVSALEEALILKWPNDLLLNGKKLGGILVESTIDGVAPSIVVGIGLNLSKAPVVPGRTTSSLTDILFCLIPPEAVAHSILSSWDDLIVLLKEKGVSAILNLWEKYSFPLGTTLEVTNHQGCFAGTYKGLSALGALKLQDKDGHILDILAGEVGSMSYLLAVDIGNSNVTFALHNGEDWVVNYRISTDPLREADEYAALLIPLITDFGVNLSKVKTVVLGSVVSQATKHFSFFVSKYLEAELVLASYADLPDEVLKLDVDQPSRVGVDRWLNILAAKTFYFEPGKPLVVIDCGTAITLDVLSKDGAFVGGAIAPGLGTLAKAFKSEIPLLPEPNFTEKSSIVGTNTQSAINAGLRCSFFGTIQQMIDGVTKELGEVPTIIGTGGTINILESTKDIFQIRSAFLTLEGLRIFARIKQKNAILSA